MPTSATGSNNGPAAGFTLVEMMVVLAIVGLMTAVVAVNFPSPGDDLVRESERFAARLLAARDNAILGNRETAAVVDADGYRFVERDGRVWRELDVQPLAATAWREATQPLIAGGGSARFSFDSVGMTEAKTLVLSSGGNRTAIAVGAAGTVRIDAPR